MKPLLPKTRRFADKITDAVQTEIRSFLQRVHDADLLWGNFVTVTFDGSNPVAVEHGLDRVPTGYLVVRRDGNFNVYDASAQDDGRLHVTANAAGTATLYIF